MTEGTKMMTWHRLHLGSDEGGPRWFLGGRPVHAGTGLILRLPDGELPVTFETHFGEPRFTLRTGVEPWWDEDEERNDGPPLTCTCDQWAVKRLELRWPDRRPWGRHG